MLSFRLGIFTGVAALCLWGLFSLLDSLNEPGLLRTEKVSVVKGCDPIDSDEARQQCPALFCQKALLDAKLAPLDAKFEFTIDRTGSETRLIAGIARTASDSPHVSCELQGVKVVRSQRLTRDEFEALVAKE